MRLLTNQLWAVDAIGSEQRDQPPNVRSGCRSDRHQVVRLAPRFQSRASGRPSNAAPQL